MEEWERRETYMVDRTKSDAIFSNLSTRDINNHGLIGVKETYEESTDLETRMNASTIPNLPP